METSLLRAPWSSASSQSDWYQLDREMTNGTSANSVDTYTIVYKYTVDAVRNAFGIPATGARPNGQWPSTAMDAWVWIGPVHCPTTWRLT